MKIEQFVEMAKRGVNESTKNTFHRAAKKVLREMATKFGLATGTYDIRTNLGGVAVAGDTTLHGESIYIAFTPEAIFGKNFMYRSCKGRRDFAGGTNHWLAWDELLNLDNAVETINRRLGREAA